jgi:hypothetical protein
MGNGLLGTGGERRDPGSHKGIQVMTEDRMTALIQIHLERYPESEIMDVYKLLHQATFGIGHLITSKKTAREWLDQEIALLRPETRPVAEMIDPVGQIVRLHLRPYLAYEGSIKNLLDAMINSAKEVQGDPEVMRQRWDQFVAHCEPGGLFAGRFSPRELALFGRVRVAEQWSAVHHSPAYESAYHPAYRVLTRRDAEALCAREQIPFEVL